MARACLGRSLHPASGGLTPTPASSGEFTVVRRSAPSVVAEHVLVTTDGSESANQALPMALAAIRACASRRVTLLRVLTPKKDQNPVPAIEWALAKAQAEAHLRRVAAHFGALDLQISTLVAEGRAAEQILRFIDTDEVDLLVMASHGSDDARGWPMGGVARKLVAGSRASVLIVPSRSVEPSPIEPSRLERVLVPLDCSARAECVLPLLAKLAEAFNPLFVLAHVVPEPEIPHRLPAGTRDRELVDELTQRNHRRAEAYFQTVRNRLLGRGIRVETVLLSDTNPARALERHAKEAQVDLTVLSAHGASAQAGENYGSVARRLLDCLVAPLWIVQDLPTAQSPRDERSAGVRPERS